MSKAVREDESLLKIKKAYASPTWWYDIRGYFILKLSYQDSLFRQVRFFSQNVHGRHLEAAIGTGTLAKMIYFYTVYLQRKPKWQGMGFDYSEEMLAGAKQKFRNIDFKLTFADVAHLSEPSESFDSINVANAIHCFPDVPSALKELYRVLKKDGKLYANVILYPDQKTFLGRIAQRICDWGMKKGILVTPYEEQEILSHFISQGFRISSHKRFGNSLLIVANK